MAVPSTVNTQNLSGIYTLNRTLSDSSQAMLEMQNVGFFIRQAVQYSNITVSLKQYTHPDTGSQHLDQEQVSTGGVRNVEDRVMDWEWTDKSNWIWGMVHGRSRYVEIAAVDDEWLREGWGEDGGEMVEMFAESDKDGWSAWQVWGFATVEAERRHVRKILAKRKGWKDERVRMVYDWKAPLTTEG